MSGGEEKKLLTTALHFPALNEVNEGGIADIVVGDLFSLIHTKKVY